MGRGGLSIGGSSVGPPARTACPAKRLGAWLLPLSLGSYQHRMTSHFPYPLSPFAVAVKVKKPQARYFGIGIVSFINTAKDRTAASQKDPQSLETLRSSVNQVHIQRSTCVFKGGGMTRCHHTCDRRPASCHCTEGRQKDSVITCVLTGGSGHYTNRPITH